MKEKTKKILGVILALVLVAGMVGAYFAFSEKTTEGSKSIVIEVIDSKGKSTEYALKTDAKVLSEAMNEAEWLTYISNKGPYGREISHINGERAVYTLDNAYWSFYVNGEYCNYGVDSQPVNDGDEFSIVYTKAQ